MSDFLSRRSFLSGVVNIRPGESMTLRLKFNGFKGLTV